MSLDAVVWTDHTGSMRDFFSGKSMCVMYSMEAFQVLKTFGLDLDTVFPEGLDEIKASLFLRKAHWIHEHIDEYDHFEYEDVCKIFDDFPILPTLLWFFVNIFFENISFFKNRAGEYITRDGFRLRDYCEYMNKNAFSCDKLDFDFLATVPDSDSTELMGDEEGAAPV